MKRKLILSLLACGAGALLAIPVQAEPTDSTATTSSTTSATTPPACKGCHQGWRHHGEAGAAGHLAVLTAALKLDATQQAEIKPILEAAHKQVKATIENTSLTKEEKMAKVKDAMQAATGQIKGYLNPTQQAQLDAIQTVAKERWHHGHKGAGGFNKAPAPSTTGTNS